MLDPSKGVVMKRLAWAVLLLSCTPSLFAINNRSYLSVFAGNDANDCSTPALACVTYARAHTQTNATGEIVVIGNGGYGSSFTITKSINVTVVPGVYAANRPAAGGAAITITAGATDIVRLEGMQIEGVGGANSIGILINSAGMVMIDNVKIKDAATGIKINSPNTRVFINNAQISGFVSNPAGTGAAIWQTSIATTAKTWVWGGNLVKGDIGLKIDDGDFNFTTNSNGTQPTAIVFVGSLYQINAATSDNCVSISYQLTSFAGSGTGANASTGCGAP
jgi:hypothetical protein